MFSRSEIPDRNSERREKKKKEQEISKMPPNSSIMPTATRDSMASPLARRTQDGRVQLKGAAAKGLLNSLTSSTLEDLSEHESIRVSLFETPSAVEEKKGFFSGLFGMKKRFTLKRNSLYYDDGREKEDEDEDEYCDCFCFKIPLVVDPHVNEGNGSTRSATAAVNPYSIRATPLMPDDDDEEETPLMPDE